MNRKKHRQAGALTGVVTSLLCYNKEIKQQGKQPNLLEMFASALYGGILGAESSMIPDVLEPATNPNHRKFFHSVLMGGIVAKGVGELQKKPISPILKSTGTIIGVSYIVHQLLDSSTPKGLPLF